MGVAGVSIGADYGGGFRGVGFWLYGLARQVLFGAWRAFRRSGPGVVGSVLGGLRGVCSVGGLCGSWGPPIRCASGLWCRGAWVLREASSRRGPCPTSWKAGAVVLGCRKLEVWRGSPPRSSFFGGLWVGGVLGGRGGASSCLACAVAGVGPVRCCLLVGRELAGKRGGRVLGRFRGRFSWVC